MKEVASLLLLMLLLATVSAQLSSIQGHSGDVLYSDYSTKSPRLDGRIDEEEWNDAWSDTIQFDTGVSMDIHVKNDDAHLWIAMEYEHEASTIEIYFDEENDGELTPPGTSKSSEDCRFSADGGWYYDYHYWAPYYPDPTPQWWRSDEYIGGTTDGIARWYRDGPMWNVEWLTYFDSGDTLDINVEAGVSVGFLIEIVISVEYKIFWPKNGDPYDATTWADLETSQEPTPPNLEIASLDCPSEVNVNQEFLLNVNIEYSLSSSTDILIQVYEHAGPLLNWTEDILSGSGSKAYPFTLTAPSTPKPDWQLNVHLFYWDGDEWIQSDFESAPIEVKETPVPSYPSDMWERIWYVNDGSGEFGSFLGLGPHRPELNFYDIWGYGTIAYDRSDYIGFISSRTIYIEAGTWEFIVGTDDGVRLWIDDELVLDKWFNQNDFHVFERTFPSTGGYRFRLEWYEETSLAAISFNMEKAHAELDIEFYPDEYILKYDNTEATITLEIENIGNADAKDVELDINVPDHFETDDDTHFEWPTLGPRDKKTKEIGIRAKRCKTGTFVLQGSYKDTDDSTVNIYEDFRVFVRDFIVTEYDPKYVKFSLSADSTDKLKESGWYALPFASELWVVITKMDLGLSELDFQTLLSHAWDLYNILETLWDTGTLPADVLWDIFDMMVGLGLNAGGLWIDCCVMDKVHDDGTLDYHSMWPLRAAKGLGMDVVNIVLDAMRDGVETQPVNDDFLYFVDKEGKLDITVFADGKEVTVTWIDNKALAIIEAGTKEISYVVNAEQAEKVEEEYDLGFFMVQEDEIIDQILITDNIKKDEKQEFQMQASAEKVESMNRVSNIPWESSIYRVSISTINSVAKNIRFNQPEMTITFNVDGKDGTVGHCNVTIPTILLGGSYTVRKDGSVLAHSTWSNDTHSFLSFSYGQSIHNIKIKGSTVIPEFSNFVVLIVFMITVSMFLFIKERARTFRS